MKFCKVSGCQRAHYANGLCSVHYQREFREQQRLKKAAQINVPDLDGERWAPVVGFEDFFAVSNLGRVKNLSTAYETNGKTVFRYEKLLKQKKDKDGYMRVSLCVKGKVYERLVHRLVAEAFLGTQPKDKPQVNHKDGNKKNNTVENLEWCDACENLRHRVYELNVNPLKPVRKVLCVETGKVYRSVSEAARAVGVPAGGIVVVCQKKKYHNTAGGYHWEYAN